MIGILVFVFDFALHCGLHERLDFVLELRKYPVSGVENMACIRAYASRDLLAS